MIPDVLSTRDRVFSQFGSIFTNTLHQPPPPPTPTINYPKNYNFEKMKKH